jgi:hypothetical protein
MDVTITQEMRQATDWLANGKFAICFFCSEILKLSCRDFRSMNFAPRSGRESRAISAGTCGSLALPSQPPHPNAARLFANWLLSREGQTALQRAANTPYQFRGITARRYSERTWCAAKCGASTESNTYGGKPEYMDMAPIQEIVEKALAQAKKK